MQFIATLLMIGLLASCGKSNSSAGIPDPKRKIIPLDGSNVSGLYQAKFTTLNPHVNGTIPGSATIQRQGDKFYTYVRLFGGAPNAWHQQNVYAGSRCPTLNDDLNGDGYIDIEEGNKVWGNILIPLDSNITSQAAGKNIYPMADASGSYFYERVTSFKSFYKDLKSDDKNQTDNVMKLEPTEGLDLEEKVAVVMGTADTVIYPETVATTINHRPYQTFPVACGVFSKVTSIPGEADTGEIPGPVGEVEPEGGPVPEPIPTPVPDGPVPYPYPDSDNDRDEDEDWYDRVSDWWRRRWIIERGDRRDSWGDGITFWD